MPKKKIAKKKKVAVVKTFKPQRKIRETSLKNFKWMLFGALTAAAICFYFILTKR